MNLQENGFYTKSVFSISDRYAKLLEGTVHLLARLTVYNYRKIISLHP
jgi:hypothetical protein